MPPSKGRGGLPEVTKDLGMAGLGEVTAACRALALRFPPSLELFLNFWRDLGFVSPSSAENVLISSVD